MPQQHMPVILALRRLRQENLKVFFFFGGIGV
jgi:hypothetical protein